MIGEAVGRRRPTGGRSGGMSGVARAMSGRGPGAHRLVLFLARAYRHALGRVAFIGITGSTGKTTTKELAR